jgi:membrane protein YqaA with SNARE-associated domain
LQFKKVDIIFLLAIIIITIFAVDLLQNESHREIIEDISKYPPFQNLGFGLLITFWVCVIGNLLPVPTPYTFVLCFSSQPFQDINIFVPLLIALIASLGCLVGEMGGYGVGRGASKLISEEKKDKLKKYQQLVVDHPKIAPFLIFLFGFTPLNDDLITVPLGLIRYNAKKTLLWCWLGKLGLMLIFSYNFINICALLGGENWIISIASIYIIIITVFLILRIDFVEIVKRLKK